MAAAVPGGRHHRNPHGSGFLRHVDGGAGGDVSDQHVDLLLVHQTIEGGDGLLGLALFVHMYRDNLLIEHLAFIGVLDRQLGAVLGRLAIGGHSSAGGRKIPTFTA